jgi:4-oxalocrotonate tautomerase
MGSPRWRIGPKRTACAAEDRLMPTLLLKVSPLQNPDRYALLARELTRITVQQLDKRAEVTAVMIDDLPPARWTIGAAAVTQATAMLEISVTQGTNTAAQKAGFIKTAFAALERLLGHGEALHPASYVIVRELPAGDWGYGGQTQQARQLARAKTPSARDAAPV